MIKGQNKILQAFLGTLMTWGLTAAGSALVFVFSTGRFSGKVSKSTVGESIECLFNVMNHRKKVIF